MPNAATIVGGLLVAGTAGAALWAALRNKMPPGGSPPDGAPSEGGETIRRRREAVILTAAGQNLGAIPNEVVIARNQIILEDIRGVEDPDRPAASIVRWTGGRWKVSGGTLPLRDSGLDQIGAAARRIHRILQLGHDNPPFFNVTRAAQCPNGVYVWGFTLRIVEAFEAFLRGENLYGSSIAGTDGHVANRIRRLDTNNLECVSPQQATRIAFWAARPLPVGRPSTDERDLVDYAHRDDPGSAPGIGGPEGARRRLQLMRERLLPGGTAGV